MQNMTFVFGKNGTLRSRLIREKVKKQAEKANQSGNIFVVVPDQYTLTAEKFYMQLLGEKQMYFVRVISLKRLSDLFFDSKKSCTNEAGQNALIWKAYTQVKDLCTFYSYKNFNDFHFISALRQQIDELKLYGITSEQLLQTEGKNPKLNDLALIYGAYEALLGTELYDPADKLYLFAQQIQKEPRFAEKQIFIDFFKVLNAAEQTAVEGLCLAGASITIGLACPGPGKQLDHFSPIRATHHKLLTFAERYGIQTQTEYTPQPQTESPAALDYLEQSLFHHPVLPYPNAADEVVHFYRASDIADEIDAIACRILQMVRDEGCTFSDFALTTRNTDSYDAYLDTVFSEYGIPLFRHKKTALRQKPAVKFLYALFSCVKNNWRRQDVLDLVKTSFVPGCPEEDIAEFEEYTEMWQIDFAAFTRPFVRSVHGLAQNRVREQDTEKLQRINQVRQQIVTLVQMLSQPSLHVTVTEFCTRIFHIFEHIGMEQILQSQQQIYLQYQRRDLYEENLQVYSMLIEALDKFVSACGEDKLPFSQFADQFFAVLDGYDIGILPTSIDAVLVGNADTIPLLGHPYVFVFGLTEGDFPAAPTDSGLLKESDRQLLEQLGIAFRREPYETFLYEQFVAYFVLTAATQQVFLSYPAIAGGEKAPSAAFLSAQEIFPHNELSGPPDANHPQRINSRLQVPSVSFLLAQKEEYPQLLRYFSEQSEQLKSEPIQGEHARLQPQQASDLYSQTLSVSATSSDLFFKCPYAFFIQNGLKIRKPQSASLSALNTGNLIHFVLERIFSEHGQLNMDDETLMQYASEYIQHYIRDIYPEEVRSAGFVRYTENLAEKMQRLLKIFRNELSQSEFAPRYFELKIGKDIDPLVLVCSGGKILVRGSVDRVDLYEQNGTVYIRVVDYKSGSKQFRAEDIQNGIDMQMMLYLYILCAYYQHQGISAQPGGVLYLGANPKPLVLKGKDLALLAEQNHEQLEKQAQQNVGTRSGMLLGDPEILKKMDSQLIVENKGVRSQYIPEKIQLASCEEFSALFARIEELLQQMGTRIYQGDLAKAPQKFGANKTGCEYCMIKDVCETAHTPAQQAEDTVGDKKSEEPL